VVGDLPFIPDPWLQKWSGAAHGFSAPAGGNNTYAAVIVTESEIEMPTVPGGDGNMKPRILQLGLLANLTGQYVGVHFDTAPADRDDAISETPQGLQPVPAVGRTALPFESTRRFVRRAAMVPIRAQDIGDLRRYIVCRNLDEAVVIDAILDCYGLNILTSDMRAGISRAGNVNVVRGARWNRAIVPASDIRDVLAPKSECGWVGLPSPSHRCPRPPRIYLASVTHSPWCRLRPRISYRNGFLWRLFLRRSNRSGSRRL
jgi:hypothetical protein